MLLKILLNHHNDIEKKISNAIKSGSNVIVIGPLTIKTHEGYLPLVPRRFFTTFKPEIFMLFEVPKTNSKTDDIFDWTQQEINRSYASMYAALGNSLLNIIPVGKGSVKDAIRECTRTIEYFVA